MQGLPVILGSVARSRLTLEAGWHASALTWWGISAVRRPPAQRRRRQSQGSHRARLHHHLGSRFESAASWTLSRRRFANDRSWASSCLISRAGATGSSWATLPSVASWQALRNGSPFLPLAFCVITVAEVTKDGCREAVPFEPCSHC